MIVKNKRKNQKNTNKEPKDVIEYLKEKNVDVIKKLDFLTKESLNEIQSRRQS